MLNSESESPPASALLLVRVEFLPVLGRRGLFLAVPVPIPAVSPAGIANVALRARAPMPRALL